MVRDVIRLLHHSQQCSIFNITTYFFHIYTKEALSRGIEAAQVGNHIGDIGAAIEKSIGGRYGIVRELGGHGVGKKVHEDPFIPNFGVAGTGTELVVGMVLALEPMLNEGSGDVELASDGYTFKTVDGKTKCSF